jgi:hypothetical protein
MVTFRKQQSLHHSSFGLLRVQRQEVPEVQAPLRPERFPNTSIAGIPRPLDGSHPPSFALLSPGQRCSAGIGRMKTLVVDRRKQAHPSVIGGRLSFAASPRVEATEHTLPIRSFGQLAEDQKPGQPGDDPGARGRMVMGSLMLSERCAGIDLGGTLQLIEVRLKHEIGNLEYSHPVQVELLRKTVALATKSAPSGCT